MGELMLIGIAIIVIVAIIMVKVWHDVSKDSRPVDYSQISARIDKENQNLEKLLDESGEEEEEEEEEE